MIIEYGLSLIYLNIISYLYLNFALFIVIFIFNVDFLKTVNDLKSIGNLPFFSITLIMIIFSLAGVPPTLGFVSKSLVFLYLFFKKNLFFLFFLTVLNFLIMYFYIRNIRYIVTKSYSSHFLFDHNYAFYNWNLVVSLAFFNVLNFLSIFFVEDLLILTDNLCTYINFF
jgi:NADH-quinone oxidoreductase subunit N